MKEYSDKIIDLLIEFIQYANEESQDEFTIEQVYSLMDAFDPDLKHQIIMKIMIGETKNKISIYKDNSSNYYSKIDIVKELRKIYGISLMEAKDYADQAEKTITEIPIYIETFKRRILRKNLEKFGAIVV